MSTELEVFVSYAREGVEDVRQLVRYLTPALSQRLGRQVNVWLDYDSIHPGDDFPAEIQKALSRAAVVVAVVDRRYLHTALTRREYEQSLSSNRPVVLVVPEDLRPTKQELSQFFGERVFHWMPKSFGDTAKLSYFRFIHDLARSIAELLTDQAKMSPLPGAVSATALCLPEPTEIEPKALAKGYVFLSYAEEDSDFVTDLREFFGKRGYAYWEYEGSDRDYQKRIDLELESVILGAVATVSVLSESWKASTWSLREMFFSQEIGKPVFLLKAKPIPPTLAIAGFPYIDFTRDSTLAYSKLAKELLRAGL